MVAVGRRILPKAEIVDEAAACLRLLSGRAHRVYTGVAIVTPSGAIRERIVETRLRFKRLSSEDIEAYLASGEWRGKAGGYAIQGIAGSFVVKLVGCYSGVVGLPLLRDRQPAGRGGLSRPFRLAEHRRLTPRPQRLSRPRRRRHFDNRPQAPGLRRRIRSPWQPWPKTTPQPPAP